MNPASSMTMENPQYRDLPWKKGAMVSVIVHLCVLIGIPLFLQLLKSKVHYERPATFQLVVAPPSLKPFTPAVQKRISRPVEQPRKSSRPVPSENSAKEENVDELASVLDELPSPVSASAVGNTKFNPYIAMVQGRVESNWHPSTENRLDSVVVAFTIFSDGSFSEPTLLESSNATLNEMALQAVKMVSRFGPLPPGVAGNKYEMHLTLRPTRK